MECRLAGTHDIVKTEADGTTTVTTTVVFGRVELFHVIEPLLEEGPRGAPQVKFEGYRPIGRLGGDAYVHLGNYFDIPRPVIEK
jgi:flavin reductase (DIM6/NTAB) family NADH-FMN oxidoreductase RutF